MLKTVAGNDTQKDAILNSFMKAAEHELTRFERDDLFAMSMHYSPVPD